MLNFFRLTCVEIIFLIRFLTDPRYIARSLTQERAGMCIEAEKKFIRVYILYILIRRMMKMINLELIHISFDYNFED